MFKILLIILINITLFSKELLFLNYPKSLPSKEVNTSFGKELINLINNSKKSIYFAIYGIRNQTDILKALIDAKNRGINIKVVVDSDSRGNNYYTDTNQLYKYFDVRTDSKSHIMHNKFFIFDEKIVWTGSSNISDTGTGGYNSNNVVIIENKEVADAYINEFNQLFNNKFSKKKYEHSLENIKTKDSVISIYFSPKSNTYNKGLKNIVKNAKEYIYIPMFYLTNKQIAYDLKQAHKRGVDVRIILDASAARNKYSIHEDLRKQGIKVKVENFGGKMHNKSMIVDDKYIVSGSMNFTKAGNKRNDENTVLIENSNLAMQYKDFFLNLWKIIPNKYLYKNPNPESFESINSCVDNIDNDFDKSIDLEDSLCFKWWTVYVYLFV